MGGGEGEVSGVKSSFIRAQTGLESTNRAFVFARKFKEICVTPKKVQSRDLLKTFREEDN
jgi:hypothetical protein